jgi:hypothetical protein
MGHGHGRAAGGAAGCHDTARLRLGVTGPGARRRSPAVVALAAVPTWPQRPSSHWHSVQCAPGRRGPCPAASHGAWAGRAGSRPPAAAAQRPGPSQPKRPGLSHKPESP